MRLFLTRKEYDVAIDLGFGRYFRNGTWSLAGVEHFVPMDVATDIVVKVIKPIRAGLK